MICEPCLPNFGLPLERSLGLKRVAAFDELNYPLKRAVWSYQEMDVVMHDDEVVKIHLFLILLQRFE